ncbi:MAG: hypothetical protein ACI9VM_000087 [Candidatus Azotimanducaceae bacterium]|jgi:hypothetical protein
MIYVTPQKNNSGFALLLTLIVVSVVLSIGLSLIDTTLKQLTLSGLGRDAEIAFHAAYAGAECAHYYRWRDASTLIGEAPPILGNCLSSSDNVLGSYSSPETNVHLAQYAIDWGGSGSKKCTKIDLYLYDAFSQGVLVSHDILTVGDQGEVEFCEANSVCTVIISRGYNRACTDLGSIRTVEQEVILQY